MSYKIKPIKGLKVEIEDKLYRDYYKTSNKIDAITHVFYDPFSKYNFVLLESDMEEYRWPSNLKPVR